MEPLRETPKLIFSSANPKRFGTRITKKAAEMLVWILAAVFLLAGCAPAGYGTDRIAEEETLEFVRETGQASSAYETETADKDGAAEKGSVPEVIRGESYSDMWGVSHYLAEFGELPPNYITKKEARDLGWESSEGNLWDVAPGMSIGGDTFGNREGLLPEKEGRKYRECDINYEGGYRTGERIVFSSDGLIYYSEDHYENFVLLYDGEEWNEESYD